MAPGDDAAAHARVGFELLRRARLPDAGLADQHHDAAATRERIVERAAQPFELAFAPDEDTARQPVERVGLRVGGRARQWVDALERCEHLGRRGRAVARCLGEQPQDQRFEVGWAVLTAQRGPYWRGVDVLRDHYGGVVADERRVAGDQFVEHRAERVEVGLRRDLLPERLLGRHVPEGADHHPVLREAAAALGDRQPEVADLRDAVRRQPDVARLEVPVHHTVLVSEDESVGRGLHDLEALPEGEPTLGVLEQPLDVTAAHQLVTTYGTPSWSPKSRIETMCGCTPIRPIACASRTTRSRPTSSRPSVLMSAKATSRSSSSSCAR